MRAEPDGYTIGAISDSPMTVNPWMYEKLAYKPLQDFIPVARINHFPSYLVANPQTGLKTVADLIKLAKEKPGTLNYSSGGVGNFSHLGLAVLAVKTGINIVHVPYRGVGPATTAVLAGDVQLMYNNVATALPHVEAHKLNGLAVGGEHRLPALPDVPTVAETVPGFDVTPWVGLFVPAKTPKDIVARLSKETEALLKDPEVVKIFDANQIRAAYLDSEPFAAQIKKETDDWGPVIKTLGHQGELDQICTTFISIPSRSQFRDTVRDFVEAEVKPVTLKADRLDLGDRTLPPRCAAQGLAARASHPGCCPRTWAASAPTR